MLRKLRDKMKALVDSGDSINENEVLVSMKAYNSIADSIVEIEKRLDSPIKPNTIPYCPFCQSQMIFTEANQSSIDEVKQHLTCNQCNVMVYIHHFI